MNKKITKEFEFPLPESDRKLILRSAYTLLTTRIPSFMGIPIALSGPQLGINRKMFIIRYFKKDLDHVVFYLNPKILRVTDDKLWVQEEGCLSIPEKIAKVERVMGIEVQYQGLDGEVVTEQLRHHDAGTFLHEYDHLDGILMTEHDRLVDLEDHTEVYEKFLEEEEKAKKYQFLRKKRRGSVQEREFYMEDLEEN